MTLSIGTRIPPKLGAAGLKEVAQFAQSIGLTALDLPEIQDDAVAVCHDHGLRIGTVDAAGAAQLLNPDSTRRREAVDRICKQIERMSALGATTLFMCLVPEDQSQSIQDSLTSFKDTFRTVAAACEQYGVNVALEGWPGPAPNYPTLGYTPEVWRAMFDAVPSKSLGLCFDPSHLVRLGIDYMRVFAEFRDRIYHCHGKDTELLPESTYLYGNMRARLHKAPGFSEGPWRYCIPGDGEVDWKRIVFQLTRVDYSGCISIELEDARYWGTLALEQQGITRAYRHLASQF